MAPKFNQNQSVAALRNLELSLVQDDGVTPASHTTVFTGTVAKRALLGTTGVLTGAIIERATVGVAGNAYTIQFVNDGTGGGNVTTSGGGLVVVFHYQSGVTTVANAIAALTPFGFVFAGSFTPGNILTNPGDTFGPLALAGGTDSALFVRQGSANDYLTATGTFASATKNSVPFDGGFVYQFAQSELNFVGSEVSLGVFRIPDPAQLSLIAHTSHVDTIVYDKTAAGAAGNATTLAFAADGAGAGTLNEGAYPAIVFHYAPGTTTVKNFEDAVVASTHLAILSYGTWTNVLANPADTFAAANFSGGVSYQNPQRYPCPMEYGDVNSFARGSNTIADLIRGIEGVLAGRSSGYDTPTIVFKDPTGTKIRYTITRDNTGRINVVQGDLTGP